ncbi:MAG: glycosyltransferase family 4 protein [bacterium]
MKILVLNYEFPPLGGGAGNATYYLLKEFSKIKNLEIDLVTSSVNESKVENFSDKIKVHYLDVNKNGNLHYQRMTELLKYALRARKYCKKLIALNKYDLVHAFFGIPCGYVAKNLNLPFIVSLRGSDVPFYNDRFYWLDKLLFVRMSKNIWKRAKKVIANSLDLKNKALLTNPRQPIDVIYNGVDIKEFTSSNRNKKEVVFISTSRLIKRKGIDILVEAFLKIVGDYKNARLVLIGGGNMEAELKRIVIEKGLSKNIEFAGVLKHEEISEYLGQADAMVLPSKNEGMSNSLLEAMASGLAIITSNTGGAKEIIKDNGIILSNRSVDAVYKSMKSICEDNKYLKKLKIASRKKAEELSWSNMANKYMTVYRSIAELKNN